MELISFLSDDEEKRQEEGTSADEVESNENNAESDKQSGDDPDHEEAQAIGDEEVIEDGNDELQDEGERLLKRFYSQHLND